MSYIFYTSSTNTVLQVAADLNKPKIPHFLLTNTTALVRNSQARIIYIFPFKTFGVQDYIVVNAGASAWSLSLCVECSLTASLSVCVWFWPKCLVQAWIEWTCLAAKSGRRAISPTLHKGTHKFTRHESRHNTERTVIANNTEKVSCE